MPSIKNDYDTLASRWQLEIKFGPTHRIKRKILERIFKNIKSKFLCDIGCGSGLYSHLLQNKNFLYAVDLSSKALQLAGKDLKKTALVCADANYLPFKDNFFDGVLLLDILEHIEDDTRVIREVYRTLNKGGFVIFSVPQDNRLFSKIDIKNKHYRRYSKKELLKKFSPFTIRYLSSVGFPLMRIYLQLIMNSPQPEESFLRKNKNLTKIFSNLLFWLFHFDLIFKGFPWGVLIFGVIEKNE